MVGEEGGTSMMLCLDNGSICPCKYNNLSPPIFWGKKEEYLFWIVFLFPNLLTHYKSLIVLNYVTLSLLFYSFNDSIVQL